MPRPRPSFQSFADRLRDACARGAAAIDELPPFVVPFAVFAASLAVLASRRPDAFLHPAFYAEDGALWFARAYNFGPVEALFIPDAGYLQVLSTGTAAIAVLLPVAVAPLVFAIAAAIVEVSPAVFLATRRASQVIPHLGLRLALAFSYLALPNTWTNSVVVTYSSWRLALVAFLVLVTRPKSRWGEGFDAAVIAVCGLASPFVIFLLPVAAVHAVMRPKERTRPLLAAAVVTSAIQIWHLAHATAARPTIPLGASPGNFCRIVSNQFVYSLMLGRDGYTSAVTSWPWLQDAAAVTVVAAAALCLAGVAAVRGPYVLRLFLLFTSIVFAATLSSATVTGPTQWESLAVPGAAVRYYLYGMLAIVVSLGWMATRKALAVRATAVAMLAVILVFGVRGDWRHPAVPRHDFGAFVRELENAPPGTTVETPIEPPGWKVQLLKR